MTRSRHLRPLGGAVVLSVVLATIATSTAIADSWQPLGKLTQPRSGPSIAVLKDGSILITGGEPESISTSAERFDPVTMAATPVGAMSVGRAQHQSGRLADGRVAMLGGDMRAVELFDPVSGQFAVIGPLAQPRFAPGAALLPDGRILITGGWAGNKGPSTAVEIFDPVTKSSQPTGSMTGARYDHAAVTLPDGRVVIMGGLGAANTGRRDVEIYDPKVGTFAKAGNLLAMRWHMETLLLPDGRVLVAGGVTGSIPPGAPSARIEIYDPATAQSTLFGSFAEGRFGLALVPMPDGRLLAAGGLRALKVGEENILRTAEIIDLKAGTIAPTAPMTERRIGAVGFALPDGRVLLLGGANGKQVLDSGEVYAP